MTTEELTEAEQQQRRKRGRRILLILMLLFALPYAASFILMRVPGLVDLGTRNYGELIEPVSIQSIPFERMSNEFVEVGDFTDKWTILLVGGSTCIDECLSNLYKMRQVRKALGVQRAQLRKAYVNVDDTYSNELQNEMQATFPATQQLLANAEAEQLLSASVGLDSSELLHQMLVIDPSGYLVLMFNKDADPKGMLADLEILLSTEVSEQAP